MLLFLVPAMLLAKHSILLPTEEELAHKIEDHFILEDYARAEELLKWGYAHYSDSLILKKLELKQLSRTGRQREALEIWKKMPLLPDKERRHLLEELAWGTLVKGEDSQQFPSRYFALLGAFFTRDARATFYLQRALRSSNAALRSIAVQMVADYRDPVLIDEIIEMIESERNQNVRYALMQTVGRLKIYSVSQKLEQLLDGAREDLRMRGFITEALVHLYEDLSQERLYALLNSPRTAMRYLGARLIAYLDRSEEIPKLIDLLDDPSIDIRVIALCSLGEFSNKTLQDQKQLRDKLLLFSVDTNPHLALTASWLLLRTDPVAAQAPLHKLLYESHQKIRLLATSAITIAGEAGLPLLREALYNSPDEYVRLNSANGLLSLREETKTAKDEISHFLHKQTDQIMIDRYSHPIFSPIAPSLVRHSVQVARRPEMVDHQTRLSLISLLAIVNDPRAESLIKEFLLSQNLNIGMTATVTLMKEGSNEGLELIRNFLHDSNPKLRLQAALALAFLWQDPAALSVLTSLYEKVPYETKLVILEAVAGIGGMAQIPFLLERLEEPFLVLRIAASSALIQALHH
ncbi:MAG: hypothetical protein SNF33_01460 [Candidatus Algichlamydia australiensis]|nr:hypothetical protein [Chlamydiales bacterium]